VNQDQTPLLLALQRLANQPHAAFYAPGHKGGRGASPRLRELVGEAALRGDLPELPELDDLFAPQGVIREAQGLAAQAFGADQTWFLATGSTPGFIAATIPTCGEGHKIILPRNSHKSAIAGLILSGATPIFINPEYDPHHDLVLSITPEAVEAALEQHSDAKAVMMVYPTYQGVCGDLSAIAHLVHRYHLPLIVDEAHGGHLHFHPSLPPSALSMGADVVIQSTHKTLTALSQASMLHVRGERVKRDRVSQALQLVQSTSPNYLLLASLDAARQQMVQQGKERLTETLELATTARQQLNALSIPTLNPIQSPRPGFTALDPTRLTVFTSTLGMSGFEADEILHEKLGVTAELPLQYHLTLMISVGNNAEDIQQLVKGFTILAQLGKSPLQVNPTISSVALPPLHLSPRQAYFASTQTCLLAEAVGKISAEMICPYPPGIPILMPGELITQTALEYLQDVQRLGGKLSGCRDASLQTIQVVDG
jgi:arginine decarboxylase